MIVNILSNQGKYARGFNDFHPLIKWEREFSERGIKFLFTSDHKQLEINNLDKVVIDYRYLYKKGDRTESERNDIIHWINRLKKKVGQVILFDTGDGTGSRCFWLTPHVDLHVKKQLLKDKKKYVSYNMVDNYMIWIPADIIEEVFKNDFSYVGCMEDQLHKLRLGWNIGFVDYRYFPFSKYYPVGTSSLFNQVYKCPTKISSLAAKDILVSYRGGCHDEPHYNYQRKKVFENLKELSRNISSVIVGGRVSKKKYLKELKRSKVIVSPYGWGEICYRDFEAFINGALLLKPDMLHLETFPDIFLRDETYIPLKWDISDLNTILEDLSSNYESYQYISKKGQEEFFRVINDFELFYAKFEYLINENG